MYPSLNTITLELYELKEVYLYIIAACFIIMILSIFISLANRRTLTQAGHYRTSNLENVDLGSDLEGKLWTQAGCVGKQGFKRNVYAEVWGELGCRLTAENEAELLRAARWAHNAGILRNSFGYKLSRDNTKVCYANQAGNISIRSSANAIALVRIHRQMFG